LARSSYLFTSESVSEGHPDKVCDRISDEIVDLVFREAKKAGMDPARVRIACETLATTNRVIIAGEVRVPETLLKKGKDGKVLLDAAGHPVVNPAKFKSTARKAIKAIGYEQSGFHWKTAKIDVLLHGQSADIAQGVDESGNKDVGAGDQGIMFGYASRETPELLPAPIYYAHKILEALTIARKAGEGAAVKLGPDAKSQVTIRYENGKPIAVTQIVVSTQHVDASLSSEDVRKIVEPYVRASLPEGWISKDTVWHVNPTGKFVVGGPDGDAGLTGRKIIVDTYGGAAPHGGGAFSGKDPTKVDRSAAYAARYLAKNVVAAGLADRATIQLSYAIGVAKPLSIYVDLHGTGKVDAGDRVVRGVRPLASWHPHPPRPQ
jgi:S-adenosylmethionine synthetase